ncbi:hypothetical protein FSP39_015410 [Pinctada imbricata]|uniref:PLAT domain-containing protein n=1 Tax=Pinctada imbricata TaxID=66713 RepID=A0AA88XZ46_PINIB|nr:hypothetical protein FSP39_015410 [Pinctada imbricata]
MDKTDQTKWQILPLKDNLPCDIYHYHMTVYTGIRKGAGTTSKVFFVLGGETENSEIRMLEDLESRPLSTGSVNNYIVSLPHGLNDLHYLTIWHDTTGKGEDADWYLNMIIVRDIQTGQRYIFLCDMWLSVDKGDGQVERVLPVASNEEIQAFGHLFFTQTRKDLTDGHLWISVLARPMYSNFSRVQRLSCCLSLLFLTMITNAMWYMSDGGENQQNVSLGPFTFSAQEFSVSILGSLIVVPVNLLIITMFRKSRPYLPNKDVVKTTYKSKSRDQKKKKEPHSVNERRLASYLADNWVGDYETNVIKEENGDRNLNKEQKKRTMKGRPLPHWCIYIAWVLVALSVITSAFFVILYSNEWGSTKSSKWLTSFFLSFIESVLFIQPLKVIVVAIFFAILFKTIDEDENEIIETFKAETRHGVRYTEATCPAHRVPYTVSPISDQVVFEAREHRKKMNKLFEVLREIMIYLIYLIVVAVLAYENMDLNSFRTFTTITNRFVFPATIKEKNFINVSSVHSFWDWTHDSLVPNLHSRYLNNGSISTDLSNMISDNTHYLMGPARLRQARITKDPTKCKVSEMVKMMMSVCEPDYKVSTHDGQNYFPGWSESGNDTSTPWKYQDTFILDGLPMRIRTQKRAFLLAAWNYVDFANICMSISLCALYGVHFVEAKFTLDDFRENKDAYVNLNHLLMWDQIYHHVLSFLLFSSMLKLLQLIRFNTKISQLSSTLARARGPIISFFVVFTGIIMAFSSSGYMIFGRADPQYKSFFDSIETLMSMLMMKVDINNMLLVNGTLGYLYLFLFVLLIVFILINMLLSILNDAFTEVREDPKLRAEDPKVVDFLIEQLKKLIFSDHSKPKGKFLY